MLSVYVGNDGFGFATLGGDHEQAKWLSDFLDLSLHVDEDGKHFVRTQKRGRPLEFHWLAVEPNAPSSSAKFTIAPYPWATRTWRGFGP